MSEEHGRTRFVERLAARFSLGVFRCALLSPREAPALDELEHSRQLSGVEPDAMLGAGVDDDATHAAKILPVHQGMARGAGDVSNGLAGHGPLQRPPWNGGPADLAAKKQLPEQRVLDELASARRTIEEPPRLSAERLKLSRAPRARKRVRQTDGFEAERLSAARTIHRVWRTHLEASGATDGRDGRAAIGAVPGSSVDRSTARRTGDALGHDSTL